MVSAVFHSPLDVSAEGSAIKKKLLPHIRRALEA